MNSSCPDGIPARLTAPEPGWTTRSDVVVVGSGIAGLTAALRIHANLRARSEDDGSRVLLVTKDVLSAGSTQGAQGGIAAALGEGDTPEQHERDKIGRAACRERGCQDVLCAGGAGYLHKKKEEQKTL